MAFSYLQPSSRAARAPSIAALAALESVLSSFSISSSPSIWKRSASHAAQGRANKAKDGAGKRLGAKKFSGQYVIPGNILFRQRGTLWFAGDGCFMGRDHTIHASVPGYVKFYRDSARHPKRKYIGVVFERNNTLPQPHNAARRRQLGMLAYRMPDTVSALGAGDLTNLAATPLPDAPAPPTDSDAGNLSTIQREVPPESRKTRIIQTRIDGKVVETELTLRPGHQWRQTNFEIGRAAERSPQAMKVKPYNPKDRFAAWRKRSARRQRAVEKRALGRGGKGGKGGKKK